MPIGGSIVESISELPIPLIKTAAELLKLPLAAALISKLGTLIPMS